MKSILIRLGAYAIFFLMVFLWYIIPDRVFVDSFNISVATETKTKEENKQKEQREVDAIEEKSEEAEKMIVKETVKQSVPFTAQAPHAQWDDPRFQDACEEASMVMAHAWITGGGNISKNDAEEEMEKLFVFENEKLGESIDTSAADTSRIFQEYYHHSAEVRNEVSMDDIYGFLMQDAIVIAPTNGKMLGNPHFSNGGPERHMVVIIGYDKKNKEFITNDPGTRLGRGYKYKDSTLYNAIRDYDTGTKEKISGTNKNVVIIRK